MAGYEVDVKPAHERKDLIAALTANPVCGTQPTFDVYEGQRTMLPVIRLPIDLPVYRMANARTQTEQLAYIAEKKVAATFFESGQDNQEAQQAQHDILKKYANASAGSVKPIIEELERTKQTEPIMLTPAGVVVNGNRRLTAMRELYASNKAGFPTFAEVECMILPQMTEDQIDDIETRLQERPETKLPYSWINEALKVRRQLAQKTKKETDIADMRRKSVGDIRKSLSALNYAEIYLKDWCKSPNDYRLVEKGGEQFFADLVPRLKGKEGALLEANMRMAWLLFDNRDSLGQRIYGFNKVLGEKAEQVLSQLAERLEIDEEAGETSGVESEEFEIDLGGQDVGSGYEPLINLFDNADRRDEVFDELRAVCQTILDTGQASKVGKAALNAVRDANTRLTEIDLSAADPETHDGIDKQLEEIVLRATALREKLKEIKAAAKPASGGK
ncbi:Uncharacterised protein [Brevundimonas vesicularis]|uniref:ParB/Sulfiredoxin domain-containing protein n=1 Tax=Brevundimonas vesicularis TaxID=41276 RepID=A0A2X1D2L4_BREVE|nr:hypothetical protein [Brevundimonas vesicularis]SPU54795.1 Uncharacterised protein [Brevundimonas vesicularis]